MKRWTVPAARVQRTAGVRLFGLFGTGTEKLSKIDEQPDQSNRPNSSFRANSPDTEQSEHEKF